MKLSVRSPAPGMLVSLAVTCAGILVLLCFPVRTARPVWDGYRILAVPASEDEKNITACLESARITSFVTESNSLLSNPSPDMPVQPLLGTANRDRSVWFINTADSLRYLYLRESPGLGKAVETALRSTGLSWFLEEAGRFTPVPVMIAVLFALAVLVITKNRGFVLCASIPFLLLPWACNTLAGFSAALFSLHLLMLLALRLPSGTRQPSAHRLFAILRSDPFILIPLLAAPAAAIFGGRTAILLFCASAASSAAEIRLGSGTASLLARMRDASRFHPAFRPVPISLSGTGLRLPVRKRLLFALLPVTLILAGLPFFTFTGSGGGNRSGQELSIPAPTGYTAHAGFDLRGYTELSELPSDGTLPDLGDFLAVRWNMETAPWRRVGLTVERPKAGDVLEFTGYKADDSGRITGQSQQLYTFDTGYIRNALSAGSTPLEKMLMKQGRFVTVTMTRLKK